MDHKRELTSVDLAALERELGGYEGAKLDKAYLYEDDLLRLKMRDFDRGRVELLIEVGENKRAHVVDADHVPDAPVLPPNFAMMLRNRISWGELADVRQFEFDRILEFEFDRPDASTTIVAELFGDGNVAVLDEHGEVVDCLETVRLKSRTVAPGTQYEFPSARFNPLTVDYETFRERMAQSDADVVRTLATQLNFGGLYGEELCTRAGIPYNQAIEETDESEFERLYEVITELKKRLRSGDLDPRVYYEHEEVDGEEIERRVDVTPIPLEEYADLEARAFETFTEALDEYFYEVERETTAEEIVDAGADRPDFESEIEKYERIIQQQQGAIEDFEADAEAEREKAELLYARYDLVDEILSTIQGARAEDTPWDEIEATFEQGKEQGIAAAEAVEGLDASEGTVTLSIDDVRVTIDATMGVEKNADQLYQEAKRIEEKKEGAQAAIEDTREDLEAVKQRREEWEAEDADDRDDGEDGNDDESEDVDWLSRASIPVRKQEPWYDRFRWFRTSNDFLVIGGRNADQNEELVKKYLEPGDKFFHAQAHGGPVTVLKATGPSESSRDVDIPDQDLREAATFAVAYSSVWKDGKYAGDAYMVDPDQVSKTPGQYAQNDIAKRLYREFKERFADESFVRKVASPDLIQEFLPPGGSRMVE